MFLELTLEIGNMGIAGAKLCAIERKLFHEDINLFTHIDERAFPDTCGHVPFLLPQLHRTHLGLRVATELIELRARLGVFVLCRLLREAQCLLPLRDGGISKLRR